MRVTDERRGEGNSPAPPPPRNINLAFPRVLENSGGKVDNRNSDCPTRKVGKPCLFHLAQTRGEQLAPCAFTNHALRGREKRRSEIKRAERNNSQVQWSFPNSVPATDGAHKQVTVRYMRIRRISGLRPFNQCERPVVYEMLHMLPGRSAVAQLQTGPRPDTVLPHIRLCCTYDDFCVAHLRLNIGLYNSCATIYKFSSYLKNIYNILNFESRFTRNIFIAVKNSKNKHMGIMPVDAAGLRVFSGISRFPRPSIPALIHIHLASSSSALNTWITNISQLSIRLLDCCHAAALPKTSAGHSSFPQTDRCAAEQCRGHEFATGNWHAVGLAVRRRSTDGGHTCSGHRPASRPPCASHRLKMRQTDLADCARPFSVSTTLNCFSANTASKNGVVWILGPEVDEAKWDEYEAALECNGGGNGRYTRKPTDQRHRPARLTQAKITEAAPPGIELCSHRCEASSLTTTSPRLPNDIMLNLKIIKPGRDTHKAKTQNRGWVVQFRSDSSRVRVRRSRQCHVVSLPPATRAHPTFPPAKLHKRTPRQHDSKDEVTQDMQFLATVPFRVKTHHVSHWPEIRSSSAVYVSQTHQIIRKPSAIWSSRASSKPFNIALRETLCSPAGVVSSSRDMCLTTH
ncbi:hypothetical protein PR048_029027 [Dryococelus australis]|uniref:Uncharacterized protein n=1 Tax=Dryococelus australis TaxID=614101 RepID=A0ABQ9GFT8_9NEOP|nr:hypothetical protein PR048_029027 [Dryococelus australis]